MLAWCAALLIATTGVASCGVVSSDPPSEARRVLDSFAAAITKQDAAAAASLTSAQGAAVTQIGDTFDSIRAAAVSVKAGHLVEYSDDTATFDLSTTYDLGRGRTFISDTSGRARKLSSGWRIQWEPALLAAGLTVGGRLAAVRTDATPAPALLDRFGRPWMTLQPVNDIIIDPARTPDRRRSVGDLARIIAPIAPFVTERVIDARLAAGGSKPLTVVSLRDADMRTLAGDPNTVPGVSTRRGGALLVTDRRISSPLTLGATGYWQALRDATAGWQVQMIDADGTVRPLAGEQGPPAPNVPSTLDPGVQLRVNDSVVDVAQPATLAVFDATSGALLAAADNDAATAVGMSLTTPDTPGSTLGPVLAAVNGAAGGSASAAATLLHQLGVGVDFAVPGVMPPQSRPGTATVQTMAFDPAAQKVTALSMGALGVAMARGSSVAPFFLPGLPTKVSGGALGPVDRRIWDAVNAAMTATARTGDASDLVGAPGLRALVGTNGPMGPGWFVGIVGSQVVVIHCAGERSGSAALQVMQRFLRSVG
ncbi:NTF2-like N-terminal transpeptidase domain-containing protein [Williamsia sp. CHRR-6]|uniref:NTF2-like N-terminal transpeptidase domain-containing protein n=1 Tax=Williamsia sp. CHRR-6 TaxID=2835871 RepID=UPI0027DE10C9|nr:NTF2-like N-terminal transpeptidase domain-containing protein [Williamsia sp. CHRR-6]